MSTDIISSLRLFGFRAAHGQASSLATQVIGQTAEKGVDAVLHALEYLKKSYPSGLSSSCDLIYASPLQAAVEKNAGLRVVMWLMVNGGTQDYAHVRMYETSVFSSALMCGVEGDLTYAEYFLSQRDDWYLPDCYVQLLQFLLLEADDIRSSIPFEVVLEAHWCLENNMVVARIGKIRDFIAEHPALQERLREWLKKKM